MYSVSFSTVSVTVSGSSPSSSGSSTRSSSTSSVWIQTSGGLLEVHLEEARGLFLAVLDDVDDFVLVLEVLAGEGVVEVDAGAPADDGLDVALLPVDGDASAGVAVVLVDLLGADGAHVVGIELAERLVGRNLDRAGVADLLADEFLVDGLEDVARADDDGARREVVLLVVDAGLLGHVLFRRVDDLIVVDGADGVVEADEVAVLESLLGLDRFLLGFVCVYLLFCGLCLLFVSHTVDNSRATLKNHVSAPLPVPVGFAGRPGLRRNASPPRIRASTGSPCVDAEAGVERGEVHMATVRRRSRRTPTVPPGVSNTGDVAPEGFFSSPPSSVVCTKSN